MLNDIEQQNVDLSRADLNLLVVFEAVLQELHVGRAADRLNLTASAVSHGLGRLRRLFNDPLFLKTPKGVVPTARAAQLSAPVADVLARMRSIVATAAPFSPATSTRRFIVGAPDASAAVFLPRLFAQVRKSAPGIDIALRQLLPVPGETEPERAWRSAWADLDARAADIAILPSDAIPLRFARHLLYEEDFVIAMRAGHPLARARSLARYVASQHLVVSQTGDPHGFVDTVLAQHGVSRRVALTVPNFMFALAAIAGTDLTCAMPRRFAAAHASRFGVVTIDPTVPLGRFNIHAVLPEVAMMDAGVAWLVGLLERARPGASARRPRRSSAS
jgi:DNA-binding transcriptional LysR family regulator